MEFTITMATIYNSELSNELREGAKIQTSRDQIPNQLGQTVVPVMEVNPKLMRENVIIASSSASATGTATPLSSSAFTGSQVYITGFQSHVLKDATCDVATGAVTWSVTQGGISRVLCSIAVLTLTAQSEIISCNFREPLKLDVNTAISLNSNTFTVGLLRRHIVVYGFVITNNNS